MIWYLWLAIVIGLLILGKLAWTVIDFWRRGELHILKEEFQRQVLEMQMKRYK